jgi:single-strand DNA-binding protein
VNEPQITLSGHLAFDPKLRYTPNGTPVVDLRVATTPRKKVGEDWVDGETLWFDVSVWKHFAENVCDSLRKGDRVTVVGRLAQSTFVREDGSEKVKLGIEGAMVGADLSRFPVKVVRPAKENAADAAFGHRYEDAPVEGEAPDAAAA